MKISKKPKISVITPTWNREKFISKLGKSLMEQTFQDFEWIVGNDGSQDQTDQIIKSIAKKAKFKIIYIKSSLRIGKSKMDNLMMKNVNAEYLIQCGSDDILKKDALEILFKIVNEIPLCEKKNYIGVFANSIDEKGKSQTFENYKKKIFTEHTYWEDVKKKIKGDGTILEQFKFLKNKKFLEVDFVVSESSILDKIYTKKKFILTNKTVKIMDRTAKNSISFGNTLSYCRGSAYSVSKVETLKNFNSKFFLKRIKIALNFWRYTIHGDINFTKAKSMFKPLNQNYFYIFLYPISFFLCIRDNILGKVRKTHIEFNENIKKTTINKEYLN